MYKGQVVMKKACRLCRLAGRSLREIGDVTGRIKEGLGRISHTCGTGGDGEVKCFNEVIANRFAHGEDGHNGDHHDPQAQCLGWKWGAGEW